MLYIYFEVYMYFTPRTEDLYDLCPVHGLDISEADRYIPDMYDMYDLVHVGGREGVYSA